MSERYAALLAEWKKTDRLAREAEKSLGERYVQFLQGMAAEPTDRERLKVHVLRLQARAQLQAALDYVSATTRGRGGARADEASG